jgi:hypothetical protein
MYEAEQKDDFSRQGLRGGVLRDFLGKKVR